ncbi:cytoplasmic tRNA 2-thiolation protein 2 isoform X2 [Citrus clementina]|uniref:cytoplasmic tRNA 2-thiolation protein 2 isoform X2 n=1 Tax=Citrus clementina TaxID=85681 RepID=UPI000CED301E|nr:cytoplasmic tRNA 2-thiolation protein 2 isoform X2 [Citrus x clementina]
MACNSATGCQSGCYKNEFERDLKPATETISDSNEQNLCVKCKANEPTPGAGEDGKHCLDCFRSNLFGKFRLAVASNALITPADNVLVAFSGGPSSRVALQFVHELQQRAQKNFDASKDRSLPVFGVGVVFVDETAYYPVPSSEIDNAIQEIKLIVSNLSPPTKELHVIPIESIFCSNPCDGRERFKKLVDSVSDATGKEDLLLQLRMLSLQKGRGYSLPADIQYADARWEIPVVLPLRDCLAQELNMLCQLDCLKTVELLNQTHSGINGLVSSFVKILQEENPSRESTIMRTAGKLTPFHFNKIPELNDSSVPLASQRRQKRFNLKPNESISSESFCSLCYSPLNQSDLTSLSSHDNCKNSDIFVAACCSSCRFQIFPKDPSSMEKFYSLLPEPLVARAKHVRNGDSSLLREQIQDFLLSDSEDDA